MPGVAAFTSPLCHKHLPFVHSTAPPLAFSLFRTLLHSLFGPAPASRFIDLLPEAAAQHSTAQHPTSAPTFSTHTHTNNTALHCTGTLLLLYPLASAACHTFAQLNTLSTFFSHHSQHTRRRARAPLTPLQAPSALYNRCTHRLSFLLPSSQPVIFPAPTVTPATCITSPLGASNCICCQYS